MHFHMRFAGHVVTPTAPSMFLHCAQKRRMSASDVLCGMRVRKCVRALEILVGG